MNSRTFAFVQSQPAAYVPIESEYPDEFARMQPMSAEGQWDIVGGLWNESDTDIPSGEGLARSFLLGQDYFKSKFGKYAVTGWLPDSFGHTWQLPQIMQLSGDKIFLSHALRQRDGIDVVGIAGRFASAQGQHCALRCKTAVWNNWSCRWKMSRALTCLNRW